MHIRRNHGRARTKERALYRAEAEEPHGCGAHLGIKSPDGQFRWPLEWPGKRGNYNLYDMKPRVRAVVLDVLGHS